jgi:rhodanese-related sulfurtransferase
MMLKIFLPLVTAILFHATQPHLTSAQFGRLLGGGPVIDTIETRQLNDMLTQKRKSDQADSTTDGEGTQDDFVLVDVRSDAEVNVSVIPGAITKSQFEKNPQLYQDKTVIVYCTVGGRSGAYAKQLAEKGVKVKNYQGSILEWVKAELPVETLDGKPTNRVHTYSDRYRIPSKYQQVTR